MKGVSSQTEGSKRTRELGLLPECRSNNLSFGAYYLVAGLYLTTVHGVEQHMQRLIVSWGVSGSLRCP